MYSKLLLTKENVLSLISSYDIFKYYIYNFKEIGVGFKSELRLDKNPTCFIFVKGNEVYYKDFALIGTLNCFDYVGKKYGLSFYKTLELIAIDFKLNLAFTKTLNHISPTNLPLKYNYTIKESDKIFCHITPIFKDFSNEDLKYWKLYNINKETLKKFDVYSLEGVFINGNFKRSINLMFGYYLGKESEVEYWKIYSPLKAIKKGKWISNSNKDMILGQKNLPSEGELLVITKSLKDVMVLSLLEIPAISFNAETVLIPVKIIENLKTRFNHIIFLYDNDIAGRTNSFKLGGLYNIPCYFIPQDIKGTKDCSDFVKNYSLNLLKKYLINTINEISNYYTKLGIQICKN